MRNRTSRAARNVLLLVAAGLFAAALYFAMPKTISLDQEAVTRLLVGALLIGTVVAIVRAPGRAKAGMARASAMEVSQAAPSLRFSDVAANEEALASLRSLAHALQSPETYSAYGARIPRGVLLYGPPGTGKTLMAKALAGEAGVPFYAVSGSDFVQIYVGVGAARVRDLFGKAKKAGRAVIFIDEIDALGKRRDGASSDEREQTLNALLTQMNGFEENEGIVVLAATNRIDTLDEALLRPGRFDRHIAVGLPERAQRAKILALHAAGKPFDEGIDWDHVAQETVGFSGAKLESMLNEAAIYAARRSAKKIEEADVRRAFSTILVGEERVGSGLDAEERRVTAVHEAGHALLTLLLMPKAQLRHVTIVPSVNGAGGYSMAVPPDKAFISRRDITAHMAVALGGRAAERILLGEDAITNGAQNDLERATQMAASACLAWGMDEDVGCLSVGSLPKEMQTGERERAAVERTLKGAFDIAFQTLSEHQEDLERISQALLKRERMTGEEIQALVA